MQRPVIGGHGIFKGAELIEVVGNKVLELFECAFASGGPCGGGGVA